MIPSKLSRAAHRATITTPSTACYACLSTQQSSKRRHSSSKASSSADRYSNKAANPAAKAATNATKDPATTEPRSHSRNGKSKARKEYGKVPATQDAKKAVPVETTDKFAALPSVPSVQNLSESDRSVSNFFSLHRPMSLTHTFPPNSSSEAFNKIFSTETSRDPWANGNSAEGTPEDVIFTLHTAIETLEQSASDTQDDGVRWEILDASSTSSNHNVQHLDGQPRLRTLEEIVAQFKPFRAPPPPEPFPDYDVKHRAKKSSTKQSAKPRQKTFTTTITVTESTDPNGHKTYSASSSPIVALPQPELAEQNAASRPLTRRDRVRSLQQAAIEQPPGRSQTMVRVPSGSRGVRSRRMLLISVRRQRKLKMKKHKYKKLMKRTRTLRRKLERN